MASMITVTGFEQCIEGLPKLNFWLEQQGDRECFWVKGPEFDSIFFCAQQI
jgi:hypothetical protein